MIFFVASLVLGVWVMAATSFLSYQLQQRFQEVERKQFYDLLNKQRQEIIGYENMLKNMAGKGVRQ